MKNEGKIVSLKRFKRSIYVYSFCEGLIFWYAVEKLFQQSIGLSIGAIVVIGLIAQAGKMLFELPSSIIADRWNRRNVLIIGAFIMITSSTILPLTQTPFQYTLFILLWTVYFAFKSGTDEAFIYDSLKDQGAEKSFQSVLARYGSFEYTGLILSSFAAGYIGAKTSFSVPYWLTVPPLLIGAFALMRLPEPSAERRVEQNSWLGHAGDAWREIKKKRLLWLTLLYAMLLGNLFIWYEYYQLYGLAVQTPEVWFGSLLAVLCLGLIVGSEITTRIKISKRTINILWLGLASVHVCGLLISDFWGFLLVLFFAMVVMQILYLSFTDAINHSIGSARRATVISLGSSASQLLFLGLALAFGATINKFGAPVAFLVASLPLLLLGGIDIMRRTPWLAHKIRVDLETIAQAELSHGEGK